MPEVMAQTAPNPPADREVPCPRCRYDLRGSRPAAKAGADGGPAAEPGNGREAGAEPLVCPECGLRTTWLDVTAPDRVADRWDVESDHAPRVRAAAVTWVRTFLPDCLWSRVRLEVPIRPWRLAVMAVLTLLAAHTVAAAAVGLAIWRLEARDNGRVMPLLSGGLVPAPPVGRALNPYEELALETVLTRSLYLAWPAGTYMVTTRGVTQDVDLWAADVGVRLPRADRDAWVTAVVAARPAMLTARRAAFDEEAKGAAWRAAANPYARHTIGRIDGWWGRSASTLLLVPAMTVAIMPASFLVLRRSMHRAKASPAHLLRAGAYTLPPAAAGLALAVTAIAVRVIDEVDVAKWLPGPFSVAVAMLVGAAWLTAWFLRTWWCFLRRYLRLPRAGLAVLLMSLLSFFAALALCFFLIDREGVIEWSVLLFPRSRFLDP